MRAIFISYRRDDAEGQAGRLFDELTRRYGAEAVFMDVAAIEPGLDFRRVIDEHVKSCGVLLAVIGKSWLTLTDETGRPRIDDPLDFVRLETAAALKRGIPVVPVLVHGARMPRAEQLPDDLKDLAFRNGVELTHARWDSDVELLVKALRPHVEKPGGVAPAATAAAPSPAGEANPTSGAPRSQMPLVLAGVGALAVAIAAWALWPRAAQPPTAGQVPTPEPARPAAKPVPAPAPGPVAKPKPPAPAPDNASPAAPPRLLARDWIGQWRLRYEFQGTWYDAKIMRTRATAERVSATYEIGSFEGRFVGDDASRISGEFVNTAGTGQDCGGGRQGGKFGFTLSSDAQRMNGWWDVCGQGPRYEWTAERVGERRAAD